MHPSKPTMVFFSGVPGTGGDRALVTEVDRDLTEGMPGVMGAMEASRRKAWRFYLLVSDAQTSSQATTPTARQPQRRRRPTRRRRRSRRDARNLQEKQDRFSGLSGLGEEKQDLDRESWGRSRSLRSRRGRRRRCSGHGVKEEWKREESWGSVWGLSGRESVSG
jgi:hypothetical protein